MKLHHSLRNMLRRSAAALALTLMSASFIPNAYADGSYTLNGGEPVAWTWTGETLKPAPQAEGNRLEVNNALTPNESTPYDSMYGAYTEGTEDSSCNTVTVSGSTLYKLIAGHSSQGNAKDNTLTLDGCTIKYTMRGGSSTNATASGNRVVVQNSTLERNIADYGQYGASNHLSAGYSKSGVACNNTFEVKNSSVATSVEGGFVDGGSGDAYGNRVDASAITGSASLYGGRASGGNVYDNHATVSANSEVSGVYAGYSSSGNVSKNTVTMTDSTASGIVCGGESYTGDVSENIIKITGSTLNSFVRGGYSYKGGASYNEVYVKDSIGGNIYGGLSNTDATHNYVEIDSTKVNQHGKTFSYIYGGDSTVGNASDNIVNIKGAAVSFVYGGTVRKGNGTATNNEVNLAGCSIWNRVYGGNKSGDGDATGNTVVLDDCSFTPDKYTTNAGVYGGFITSGSGNATGNTVILKSTNGGGDLSKGGISGGGAYDAYLATSDVKTGNKLVLDGFQGTVKSVQNFESIEITLRNWNPDEYVLPTTTTTDLSGMTITLLGIESIAADAKLPTGGEAFKLLSNYSSDASTTWEGFEGEYRNIRYGETRLVDITFGDADGAAGQEPGVYTGVTIDAHLNPQLKALSEGRIAAMTFVNRAGNLAAEQGVAQAALAAAQEGKKVATFFAMQAGHEKVDSGSYVDADGVAAMVGASVSTLKTKALTLGGFVESGWGQYVTHNSFADPAVSNVRGSGESSYAGGGALLRYACSSRRAKGLAFDASLRAGKQDTDFGSYEVKGKYVSYDISNSYIAGHVGASYTFKPVHKVETTVYGRYLWSCIGSDHADTAPDRVDFESAHSNRLRVGARAAWQRFVKWTPYVGLAYEWECSGAARAMADGEHVDAPSMRGGSVIGEIGTSWQPMMQKPFWVNASLQGSAGKTQGYSAGIGCTVAF